MLHFGKPPRFSKDVKIIQVIPKFIFQLKFNLNYFYLLKVDINAEELGNNCIDSIKIQADLKAFCQQVS